MVKDRSVSASYLICSSESRLCALPLAQVSETMRALPIEAFPGMPSFLLGLSVIRGITVPVVHVARLVGVASDTVPSRYVTVKADDRRIALAVDSVIGVRELAAELLNDVPPLLQQMDAGIVTAVTTLDAVLLLILEATRIISAAAWEQLNAQAPQI